jgi:hypothetical protein
MNGHDPLLGGSGPSRHGGLMGPHRQNSGHRLEEGEQQEEDNDDDDDEDNEDDDGGPGRYEDEWSKGRHSS